MESKHTQGQWTSNYDDNGFYVVQDIETGEDLLFTRTEYEQDRNVAELASYAPEMLEALKEVENHLSKPRTVFERHNMMKKVSELIAKGGKQ